MSINLSLVGPTANAQRRPFKSVRVQSEGLFLENVYRQSTRGDDEGVCFPAVGFVVATMHFSEN